MFHVYMASIFSIGNRIRIFLFMSICACYPVFQFWECGYDLSISDGRVRELFCDFPSWVGGGSLTVLSFCSYGIVQQLKFIVQLSRACLRLVDMLLRIPAAFRVIFG